MKDYRTWWTKGVDVEDEMNVVWDHFNECGMGGFEIPSNLDVNEENCMLEQLWAIREKLA